MVRVDELVCWVKIILLLITSKLWALNPGLQMDRGKMSETEGMLGAGVNAKWCHHSATSESDKTIG